MTPPGFCAQYPPGSSQLSQCLAAYRVGYELGLYAIPIALLVLAGLYMIRRWHT